LKHINHDVLVCDLVVSCLDLERALILGPTKSRHVVADFYGDFILIVSVMACLEQIL
jgi:hypothetical protein